MKIFDLDGPFQRYGSMVFDILVVNTLWFVLTFFSFGILAGPAITGSYAALYASVVSGEGYMFKQFFNRFLKRFFISLIFGIASNALIGLSLFNIYAIITGRFGSTLLLPVYMFIFIEVGFIVSFAYPLIAHTNMKLLQLVKTSFFLANKHLLASIISSVLNLVIVLLIMVVVLGDVSFFIFLFFAAGITFSINSYVVSKKVLKNYDFFEGVI